MHPLRLPVGSLAIVLLVGACGPDFVRSGTRPPRTAAPETVSVGEGLDLGEGASEALDSEETDGAPVGAFVLTVVDDNGNRPGGVPLRIRGPRDVDVDTDPEGRVEFRGPSGTYTVEVVLGCTEELEILAARSGRFGVVAGTTGRAEIGVRWHRRFAPSPPVYSSVSPFWPPGREVEVRYGLVDRCRSDTPQAPNRAFPAWAFETNDRLELAREPRMLSDGDGFAYVHVVCIASGPTELVVYDTGNPPDRLDLVAADYGFGGPPSCRDT